ncbi:hypothetical protein KIPB_005949, partial [Kipferlia bialata]|eukprot:g5949.t1
MSAVVDWSVKAYQVTIDTCFEYYVTPSFELFVKGFQAITFLLALLSLFRIIASYKGHFYDGSVLRERIYSVLVVLASLISVV